jgi:hypothetical protein
MPLRLSRTARTYFQPSKYRQPLKLVETFALIALLSTTPLRIKNLSIQLRSSIESNFPHHTHAEPINSMKKLDFLLQRGPYSVTTAAAAMTGVIMPQLAI